MSNSALDNITEEKFKNEIIAHLGLSHARDYYGPMQWPDRVKEVDDNFVRTVENDATFGELKQIAMSIAHEIRERVYADLGRTPSVYTDLEVDFFEDSKTFPSKEIIVKVKAD